jgi:hypothetical protein
MSEKEKNELGALKKMYDTRGIILIVAGCVLTLAYILGMSALEELLGGMPLLFVPMLIAFVPFIAAFWFWRKSAFIDRELAQVGDDDDDDDDNDDDDVGDDAPGVPDDDEEETEIELETEPEEETETETEEETEE